jgi:hypothetical protein
MAQLHATPNKLGHTQIQSISNYSHNFEIVLKQLSIIKSEMHSLVEMLNEKAAGKEVSGM